MTNLSYIELNSNIRYYFKYLNILLIYKFNYIKNKNKN